MRRQEGFTLLELVVVIIIFSLLIGVYLRYVRFYQEMAGQASVTLTLSNIRTGMAQEWVERITRHRHHEPVASLVGSNPVRWLANPPPAYFGEIRDPDPERMEGAAWYFDLARQELVYVVNVGNHLEVDGAPGRKLLRWRVGVADNVAENKAGFGDLVLQSVHNYRWF